MIQSKQTIVTMKKLLLILSIFSFTLISCKKDREPQVEIKPQSTDEITVPGDFRWNTSKDIQLTVSGKSNGLVEILSTKGIVYWKSFIAANQESIIKFSLPTYETSLQLRYMNQTVEIEIQSASLTYNFD